MPKHDDMTREGLAAITAEDVQWLLDNPDGHMGAYYHDSGSCWRLINAFRERLRSADERIAELERRLRSVED